MGAALPFDCLLEHVDATVGGVLLTAGVAGSAAQLYLRRKAAQSDLYSHGEPE